MRRTAVAAALCFVAACGTDPVVAPPTDIMTPTGDGLASVATCSTSGPRDGLLERPWPCGAQVLVSSSVTQLSNAIPNAINVWNSVFGQSGLPRFVSSGGGNTVNVKWGLNTSGSGTVYYCGANPGGTEITVHRAASVATCGGGSTNASTSLSTLLAHELGHAVGFKHLSTPVVHVEALDHCVASLPEDGGLNGSLCQAERQLVRYNYGLRTDVVDVNKPFITNVEIGGQASVDSGLTRTLTVSQDWELSPAPSTGVRYVWSSSNTAVATVTSGTAANAPATVTGVKPGTATITARINDSRYEFADTDRAEIVFTVNGGQPNPPTGLNVTNITSSAATIRWTNGSSNVTTVVEYRVPPTTAWTTTQATGVGATSRQFTGLTSQTTYQIRAKHVSGTLSSVYTSPLVSFTTLAIPSPTITNFRVTECSQEVVAGKTYNNFTMAWTPSIAQQFGSYQIAMHHTSSVTSATVIVTVPGTTPTGVAGGYLSSPQLMNRWFWVRYVRNGTPATPWVALSPNPLATNQCLL